MKYHWTVSRQQTIVQLTDVLVDRLDVMALRTARSRSAVIRDAVERYLTAHEDEAVDAAIIEGYTRVPQSDAELADADAWLLESIREEPW